ncbi:VOC family protein [uncultured Aquimarina sp.]|uniref:VOC family protein n=1 Tax=uncultured Aquimarina sp. TaxID=575652 RepID=UPI002638850A|nr:VOC family protein [uncultured Aquimarina sp.]
MNLLSLKTVIRTKDYDASKKFYCQILNLDLVEEYNSENRGCILRVGDKDTNAFLEISEIPKGHYYYHTSFDEYVENDKIDIQIKTNDIDQWAEHLNEKWEVKGPIDRPWGAQYLYLRDPDGLQIIIYQEKPKP